MGDVLAIAVNDKTTQLGIIHEGSTEPVRLHEFATGQPRPHMTREDLESLWLGDMRRIVEVGGNLKGFDWIGLALTGQVEAGVIVRSEASHWQGRNPEAYLTRALGVASVVESEVVARALAEAAHGPIRVPFRYYHHDKGYVGACLVRYGDYSQITWRQEDPGHDRALAEHLFVALQPALDVVDACGVTNCFNSYVCAAGIQARHGVAVEELGDQNWLTSVSGALCEGVGRWQHLSPTPHILLGGRVPLVREPYLRMVQEGLGVLPEDVCPQVRHASLGEWGALVGAAVVAEIVLEGS